MTEAITKYENYDRLKGLVTQDTVRERFEQALGKRAGAFIASLMTVVAGSQALMECEPKTILAGAIKAAALDLPLVPDLGYSCLVPFNNNKTGRKEAQFQIMTNGYKQLALRTKQYQILNTAKIYEGQEVVEDQLTGQIRLVGKRTSDKAIGWVSYFRLNSGYEKFFYMSIEDIHKHAKRFSKSYENAGGMWKLNPEAMEAKTVTKLNLKHNGMLSTTMLDDDEFVSKDAVIEDQESIEGVFAEEPTTAEPYSQETQPEQEKSLPEMLVAEGLAMDVAMAETMIKLAKKEFTKSPEIMFKWSRAFNAWIDATGCDNEQAAKSANAGELPK